MRKVREEIAGAEIRIGALTYEVEVAEDLGECYSVDLIGSRILISSRLGNFEILSYLAEVVDLIIREEIGDESGEDFGYEIMRLLSFNSLDFMAVEDGELESLDGYYIYIDGEPFSIKIGELEESSEGEEAVGEIDDEEQEIIVSESLSFERAKQTLVDLYVTLMLCRRGDLEEVETNIKAYSSLLTSFMVDNDLSIFRH